MKAIRFNATIPRYAAGLALGRVSAAQLWSGRSCTIVEDVPIPLLPGPDWVRIKTRLGGICGSDLSVIRLNTSPYYSAFTSFPYTFGHENVGMIAEMGPAVTGWQPGERVVVEPLLWCTPRGFDELCEFCSRGEINRCQRTNDGALAPGLFIGACRDTGGSWSPYFVAHQTQLHRVPEHLSDENALLVEPFAGGLHPALQYLPADDETVLILGAGTIGLSVLAALRALGSQAHILVAARYPFQAEAAKRLGASDVLRGDLYAEIARRTGGAVLKPIIGKQVVTGGVDRTFECVGSDSALDDALAAYAARRHRRAGRRAGHRQKRRLDVDLPQGATRGGSVYLSPCRAVRESNLEHLRAGTRPDGQRQGRSGVDGDTPLQAGRVRQGVQTLGTKGEQRHHQSGV